MLNSPFSHWPAFSKEEQDAVSNVLASNRVNYWTGSIGRDFEKQFAEWADCEYAVALANGTLALDLALRALQVGPGDEVIVTPRTFIASVSSVVNAGATPVFADVDRNSGNITPKTIAEKLTNRTKAIVPVHLAGWPCDMLEIMALAAQNDLKVIEDCAQAHGAKIDGQSVGSFGDIAAWSFCQDKIMTTGGEGGMVTTDDPELWSKMWAFKDHGKNYDTVYNQDHPAGFRWLHESFGTNWRMMEMQSVIGQIQLSRMPNWSSRRTYIANALANALAPFANAVRVPTPAEGLVHAYYRQYAYVMSEGLRDGWSRDHIVAEATARDVPLFQGSCSEVYLEKAFDGTGWRPDEPLPNAQELGQTSIMFLTHPTITDTEVDKYCTVMRDIFSEASR